MDEVWMLRWCARIAITGVLWLLVKLFFVLVALDFSWAFSLFLAMLIVTLAWLMDYKIYRP